MINSAILEMVRLFGNDAPRINHALKVFGFAQAISAGEHIAASQRDVIDLAAILHDIGIQQAEKRHGSNDGKYQELEGPPIARTILEKLNVKEEVVERVCYLVGNHHSYKKIDGIDFQILVEADFLVNIYEDERFSKNIASINERIFKTTTGRELLECLYQTSV